MSKIKYVRRKTQSKIYTTDIIEIVNGASATPVISISGGRDFYLNQIIVWIDDLALVATDIRLKFEDNTSDMLWQDKPANIQAFVNNDRKLDFKRDLAHKTDVTTTISNNSGATIKIQVIFLGYELKIRPDGDVLTPGM